MVRLPTEMSGEGTPVSAPDTADDTATPVAAARMPAPAATMRVEARNLLTWSVRLHTHGGLVELWKLHRCASAATTEGRPIAFRA